MRDESWGSATHGRQEGRVLSSVVWGRNRSGNRSSITGFSERFQHGSPNVDCDEKGQDQGARDTWGLGMWDLCKFDPLAL